MATFRIRIGIDFLHGVALPSTGSPHLGSTIEVREGATATSVNLQEVLNDISGYTLADWDNLEPGISSVDIDIEYTTGGTDLNSDDTWAEFTTGAGAIADIERGDITIVESSAVTNGTFTIALADGSIQASVLTTSTTSRFRLNILLTDSDG